MDDISSMISNVLNDPEAMAKIGAIAQSLNLGGEEENKKTAPAIDSESLEGLQKLLGSMRQKDENVELLKALRPFLSEKRQKKVDDAVKLMGLMRLLPYIKEGGLSALAKGGK